MPEPRYVVELRCGTCGAVFCRAFYDGSYVVTERLADQYVGLFKAEGPDKFVQCKNKCPRQDQRPNALVVPESPGRPPRNYNQQVVKALVPHDELRGQGLVS